ncbi:MAG: metallophosphoesterase [Bacteroidales bacterium]|nr:metallophosphoesterase [Bacteroidales bacterium]
MKKILLGLAFLASACCPFKPFTFVQMTDPQIGFELSEERTDTMFKAAVAEVNALDPALVVITGDLVNWAYKDSQDSIYFDGRALINAPVYELPGNHDIRRGEPQSRERWAELHGQTRFSVRKNGCAFIGIDSNCIKNGETGLEQEQLEWLTAELRKARRAKYTFVFMHCPIIRQTIDEPEDYFNFSAAQREQYIALFKQYGVDAVFSGHTHIDYRTEYEGIGFYACGPVGFAFDRDRSGYNVIQVSEDGFDVRYQETKL